jgi:hypothetical protein
MFCRPVILCWLICITETNRVTECRKYLSVGPHFDQPWYIWWCFLMCYCPPPPGMISPSVQGIVPHHLVWFHPLQCKILPLTFWYDFTLSTKYCPSTTWYDLTLSAEYCPSTTWYDLTLGAKYCPSPGMISPSVQSIVPHHLVWFYPHCKVLSFTFCYDFTLCTE